MDSLRRPDVAVQVQPHGSHGKVLQAAPPARKLPLHLPSPGPITGVLRGWGGVGGSPPQAQSAHLIVQAQEAQGVADTLHLVQDVGAQHHGCEGDVDGAAPPRRDHLAGTAASALDNRTPPPPPALVRGMAPRSSQPHPLTTCLGLMENRWSEGIPSCPCRMTEMIFWGAPALELPSAYGQGSRRGSV